MSWRTETLLLWALLFLATCVGYMFRQWGPNAVQVQTNNIDSLSRDTINSIKNLSTQYKVNRTHTHTRTLTHHQALIFMYGQETQRCK